MSNTTETIMPTERDSRLARESGELLAPLLAAGDGAPVRLSATSMPETELTLPRSAARALLGVLREMGKGNAVTISAVRNELTTQQAADFLMVSRPFLIDELLEKGIIPYRRVGNRRRVRCEDLVRYRETEELEMARRGQVVRDLMAETERLGLYE
jgi:excisionase family DNA binding protein